MLTLVPNSFFIFHAIPHQSRDSRSYLIPTHIHSRFVDDVPGVKNYHVLHVSTSLRCFMLETCSEGRRNTQLFESFASLDA